MFHWVSSQNFQLFLLKTRGANNESCNRLNQDKHSNCLKETEISKDQWTEIEKSHLSSESHETQENLWENTVIPKWKFRNAIL